MQLTFPKIYDILRVRVISPFLLFWSNINKFFLSFFLIIRDKNLRDKGGFEVDRTEISEIFCGAVDTIINARLQNLAYDITKQYTITKNDLKRQGIYTVSSGSVSFEARSYDKTLEVNDVVMVTIPNGDYSNEKIIIAKLEPEVPEVANYSSQLDLMQIFSDDIVVTNTSDSGENNGLLANDGGGSSYTYICTLKNNGGNLSGYTRLGISAEFQSLLNNTDTVQGNYGLKLYVYSAIPSAPGEMDKDGVYELYLDSSDMIGNPYSFNYYSKQEKVIDISMIQNISKIEVYFYQDGNFKNSTGDLINWQYSNNIIGMETSVAPNNLFVKNLQMFLGYEVGEYTNDRMVINCEESTIYSYVKYNVETGEGPIKHLTLKWLHKFEDQNDLNGKYELVNMTSLKSMGITLKWFRHNLNTRTTNKIAGHGWEEIPINSNNLFACDFTPDQNLAQERIKVIGYKTNITYESSARLLENREYLAEWQQMMENRNKDMEVIEITSAAEFENMKDVLYTSTGSTYIAATAYNENTIYYKGISNTDFAVQLEQLKHKYLESIESVTTYESEELVLTNAVKVYDSTTFNASSSLSIYYEDGSEGNYYIYDTNGRLINSGQGRGYERRMRAVYNGKEITPDLGTLDWIAWYLPVGDNSKSMLLNTTAFQTKDNGQIVKNNEMYQGVHYICIRRYPNPNDKTLNTWQSYSINNNWNSAYTNNLVRCEVSIDGVKYTTSNTMRFGKSGTQGTNTTLILEMQDNYNAITIPVPKEDGKPVVYTIVANPYDVNGNLLETSSGTWSWGWKTPMVLNGKSQPVISIKESEESRNKVELEVNITSLTEVQNGYYGIIYATYYQANGIPLTAYLTIPLKAPNYSHIEGATEITYNSAGSPQYYSDAYKIFVNNEDSLTNPFLENMDVDWDVVHDVDFYKLDKQGNRIVNAETGEYEVSAMSADYIPKLNNLIRANANGRPTIYKGLQAAPFYAEGYDDICLVCRSNYGEYVNRGTILEERFSDAEYYILDEQGNYIKAYNYGENTEYYELIKDILWVQPLLITNSNYDYSVLNEWDGSLTTDEGNGTIMGTMIGAGRKNEDNTFSGILMGDVKDAGDISEGNCIPVSNLSEEDFYKDTYYYKLDNGTPVQAYTYDKNQQYYTLRVATGLYGFQNGEISFSLKDNGIATFGKSNRGQIIIDGNQSTIMSKDYSINGNGMMLDLDDGILSIRDNDIERFRLSPEEPYLVVNGLSEKSPLMYIGGGECFLQSQNRGIGALGTKFDLVRGVLDIQGTGGNVLLSGQEADPFFRVTTRHGTPLIHMDIDDYYLQSAFFAEDSQVRKTADSYKLEIYKEKEYVPVAVSPEVYENEKDKYYIKNDDGTYVTASGDYGIDKKYYRKGRTDFNVGYDPDNSALYTVYFDAEDDEFKTSAPIDVYEVDEEGNFIYPILLVTTGYAKDYSVVAITAEEYAVGTYYIATTSSDGTVTYSVATGEFDSTGATVYYELYYYPTQDPLPDVSDDILIPVMIQSYLTRELEPVTTDSIPSGMRLDLVNGRIEGYNLKLIGTKIKTGKIIDRLIINTEDDTTPVRIGGGFMIGWDGTLSCTKVKTITNTGKIPSIPTRKGVYGSAISPSAFFVDPTVEFFAKVWSPVKDEFDTYYTYSSSNTVELTKDTFIAYIYYYKQDDVWYNAVEFDSTLTYYEVNFDKANSAEGSVFDPEVEYYSIENPTILTIGGSNVFNGTAMAANTANSATHAATADTLVGGDEYWEDIFGTHGDTRYVSQADAEKAYGPLNIGWGQSSLEERIKQLEDSSNNQSGSITNISNDVATLKENVGILQRDVGTLKTNIMELQEVDTDQNDKIAALEERIQQLEELVASLQGTT